MARHEACNSTAGWPPKILRGGWEAGEALVRIFLSIFYHLFRKGGAKIEFAKIQLAIRPHLPQWRIQGRRATNSPDKARLIRYFYIAGWPLKILRGGWDAALALVWIFLIFGSFHQGKERTTK
jgi:hypothetical protein